MANKNSLCLGLAEITGFGPGCPWPSLWLPQRVQIAGKFSVRREYVCPWARVSLNLVVLPTGFPELNSNFGRGRRQ